ncbi:hypothetical protein QTP86_000612 [Hemibagrus guttatus]|nr:hypothetical protein QTP86_000612 [Hemibagrus guttatus]
MPINLSCMSLDWGRKPEYPEETLEAQGEQANSTHTAEAGIEPPTLERAGIYVLAESKRPQRISLEILDGREEKTAQRSEQEPKRVHPKLKRFQEESLAWDPGLGVETEEWKEHQENLRKVSYKEDIQWLNLGCQTSTPYPGNERRKGHQPPEASEKESRLLTKSNLSEGKDEDRKTSISTQYEENRETEPMEKEKIPLNQEEEQSQCNGQEKKDKAEIEEEGKYHLAVVVTLTPTVTELGHSEIQRISEHIQRMQRRLDVSVLTMEDLKERTQIQSSMELEETKRRLRDIEQEMQRSGSVQRQVEGAIKYLYDSHSEFLKQSQAESGKKEEDRHQLYQEIRKMQKELDGRLNETMDELKAARERIKEKEQQRAKNSMVISTMVIRSKKQRPEEEEEVKDGLPEYDEGRSEQAQGAAAQFPVIIKGNDMAYVPWSFLDLTELIGRLPSICEGAQKWITRFEEQTLGQMLALGDIKAILSQSLGKAKMIEIFQNVNLKKEAEGQIYDPRSFGPHRNSILHSLRDSYPTQADPRRVEKIKMEEDESVAEFVLKLQKAWREEMGGAWDETAASQTLFRMMVKKALLMEVQDQLDTVVGLSTMAWSTFEANIIHYVELHRRKEREAKKAADSLVMQLHKAQLSELAHNKQNIMEKKKEEKSVAKQAAVLVAQPVAPPVAQPALPMPQPAAMTQAMPIVPPQQMQPVYYAYPPLTK